MEEGGVDVAPSAAPHNVSICMSRTVTACFLASPLIERVFFASDSFDVHLLAMHDTLSSSEMHHACVVQLLLGQCSSDYKHSSSTVSPKPLVTTSFDDSDFDLDFDEGLDNNEWFAHHSFDGLELG